MSDVKDAERLLKEAATWAEWTGIAFCPTLSPTDMILVIGAIQLALRHPAFPEHSRKRLEATVSAWGAELAKVNPALVRAIKEGWL